MATPSTPEEAIEQAALSPASVSVEGRGTVTAPEITQLIEADRYLAAKRAASRGGFGLRFSQIIPPAAG